MMPANAIASFKTADELVELLQLAPHPEGGHYRETFRDELFTDEHGRAASTAIYFLLKAGEVSRWHKVDAVEVWHWYAGAPLELGIAAPAPGAAADRIRLGCHFAAGERPQAVVPPGYWQQARSLGDFTLVGCTVAPGFIFDAFQLAPPGFEPGSSDS